MARIITQLYEHTSRALLEAALATRELGYADEASNQCLSFKTNAGAYRRFPSLERLDDNAAAVSSGAALIGFFPPAGMSATTVQAALEELASAGTGGTLTGGGAAGKVAYWTGALTLDDASFLDVVGSSLQFSGDALANLYRGDVAFLYTDGGFLASGSLYGDNLVASGFGQFSGLVDIATSLDFDNSAVDAAYGGRVWGELTKNNANVRTFYGLQVKPEINAGGSNASTTLYLLDIDSVNTSLTGVTTRLLRISYGGAQRLLLTSGGQLVLDGGGGMDIDGDADFNGNVYALQQLTTGQNLSVTVPIPTFGQHNSYATFSKNNSTTVRHALVRVLAILNGGGSNANETLDVLKVDTDNVSATGMTVNLISLLYGGAERFRVDSAGGVWTTGLGNDYVLYAGSGPDTGKLKQTNMQWQAGALGINVTPSNDEALKIGVNGTIAAVALDPTTGSPAAPSAGFSRFYLKGGWLVVQYNDAGTTRYKYLDLAGTGVTWVHTTSAP